MSNKRPLNDIEKSVATKNLAILKGELEYKERVELAKKKLNLDVVDLEIKKQTNELKQAIKQLEAEVDSFKKAIEVLEDQIENGVEIKEITPIENNDSKEE